MENQFLAREPRALLSYMAADRGIRDLFGVQPTHSDRKQESSARGAGKDRRHTRRDLDG
jgi:hypothetical protein